MDMEQKIYDLIVSGNYKKLAKLLEGSDICLNDMYAGTTPLLVACDNEEFDIVRLLVEKGADVNRADEVGQSPLHFAVDSAIDANCGHEQGRRVDDAPVDIIVYLLWKGADPLREDGQGKTPIDWAVRAGVQKIEDLLRKYIENHNKSLLPDGRL